MNRVLGNSKESMAQSVVVRSLYRACLRGHRALESRALPLQTAVGAREWGHFRRVDAQVLDSERDAVFPWASRDVRSEVECDALLEQCRRAFRRPTADVDGQIDEAFSALRSFHELLSRRSGSSYAVTCGVRVTALASYLGVAASGAHVFAYRIRIANDNAHPVQLRSRHWVIEDDQGKRVVVPKGSPGVVGQTPRLAQGQCFEYASGTELHAPTGTVSGSFQFATDDGDLFDVQVSPFNLVADVRELDDAY